MTTRRWLLTAGAAAALVGGPLAFGARPVRAPAVSAPELARRIRGTAGRGWSGLVETTGGLRVPAAATFANLGPLLGSDQRLRAWWRGATDWRIDRITGSGETDLVRHHDLQLRWTFGSQRAVFTPVSALRLPDVSDLLPPTLGRRLLAGARDDELTALPAARVAGTAAAGLRLVPQQEGATIRRVDLWADPTTGTVLRLAVHATDPDRPVLTTGFTEVDLAVPPAERTRFVPAEGMRVSVDQSVDAAAEANALTGVRLPASLAGLPLRTAADGRLGVYGRGPTSIFLLPLRATVARPLRLQLRRTGARRDPAGTLGRTGPIGLLLTGWRRPTSGTPGSSAGYGGVPGGGFGSGYLLTGTVTDPLLRRAAGGLVFGS